MDLLTHRKQAQNWQHKMLKSYKTMHMNMYGNYYRLNKVVKDKNTFKQFKIFIADIVTSKGYTGLTWIIGFLAYIDKMNLYQNASMPGENLSSMTKILISDFPKLLCPIFLHEIYEATCSCACEEAESWCFMTSGSSGGVDKAAISRASNSPSSPAL